MGEFQRMMKSALDFLDTGNSFALVTVVRVRGAAPRHSGARMLVLPDGRTEGTVGGATLEQRVIQHALEALSEGRPRYETYLFSTRPEDKDKSVGLCGGEVDIHIDVVKPDPRLMIIGAGHIAIPLARMAAMVDMRVVVVDDRPEYATRERFPDAEEIHIVRYDEETEQLAPMEAVADCNTFVVVATWGWDQPALAQVLTGNPAYVALVASPAKARAIFQGLLSQGIPEARLAEVRTPAGLDIGAETPAEIALSILAEILSLRRFRSGKPMMETRRQGPPSQE
mgnify:CR=1 FL=1